MKRFVALLLTLTLLLVCVTACSPKAPPPQGDAPSSQEETTAPRQPQNSPRVDGGIAAPDPPQEEEVTLVVAQRSEREFAFRVTVPNLPALYETDNNGHVGIFFESSSGELHGLDINPFEEEYDNRLRGGTNNGSAFLIMGNVEHEQGEIWALVRVPDETTFDWNALDVFEVEVPHPSGSGYSAPREFNRADIERPMEEVSEDVARLSDMSEFYVDRDAISLKAKDNEDGTLTFTYRDTAMEQAYLYPQSWLNRENVADMFFSCWVGGKFDYNPSNMNSAIQSGFGFRRSVGGYDISRNLWDTMTVNMTDSLSGKGLLRNPADNWENEVLESEEAGIYAAPDGFSFTIDENGLTATWTQAFQPGYSMEDVAAFQVILQYDISVLGHGEQGLAFLQTRFTPEHDALGQAFGFEVADVME